MTDERRHEGVHSPGVDVLRPKELETHPGDSILAWASGQLAIARSILDNPGGGLLFATQTLGQVRSALRDRDLARWEAAISMLEGAEDAAVRRDYRTARERIDEASSDLSR